MSPRLMLISLSSWGFSKGTNPFKDKSPFQFLTKGKAGLKEKTLELQGPRERRGLSDDRKVR